MGHRPRWQRRSQHFDQSVAVLDSPMTLVEPTTLRQEIAQFRSFKPKAAPRDFGMGASPCLKRELFGQALAERSVKASIMCDDQIRRSGEFLHRLNIEFLTGEHVWRDPRQARNLRTDRCARLTSGILTIPPRSLALLTKLPMEFVRSDPASCRSPRIDQLGLAFIHLILANRR